MALKSLRITKKELQTYYTPKVSDYEMMVNSINSNMGYGQIIQAYTSTETGVEVTNTYYHVYDNLISQEVVMDKTSGTKSSVADAGPSFWGVGSNIGIDFLNGVAGISGLRKLKYCDGCSDGNGLDKPVVDNFSKRFRKVEELVLGNNLLEGFLFYDLALPKYSNVFPAIKKDDGVNIIYQFKDVNTGTDLTPEDVAIITNKEVYEIEESVDTAPIIKPQEGANTVITSCCDESISYVIQGQYTIGEILQLDGIPGSSCWYVESLTKELPNSGMFVDMGSQRSCAVCVSKYPCPSSCEDIELSYSKDLDNVCDAGQKRSMYQVDWNSGRLFNYGECGYTLATSGYYSDGKYIYYWNEKSFDEYGPCGGGGSNNYTIRYCCTEFAETVDAGIKGLTSGTFVYFSADDSGTYPVPCWYVVGPSPKSVSITGTFTGAVYETCKDCTFSTRQFC
jgi:hypothetical protein